MKFCRSTSVTSTGARRRPRTACSPAKPPPTTTTRCGRCALMPPPPARPASSSRLGRSTKSRSRISTNDATAAAKATIAAISRIVFRPPTSAERAVVGDEAAQRRRASTRSPAACRRSRSRARARARARRAACRSGGRRPTPRTCEARIVPSPATPVAMPTWRRVELMPDAIPARAGSTTPTAVETSGVLTSPAPRPATIIPASRCVQSELGVRPRISSRPAPISDEPGADQEPARHVRGQPAGDAGGDEDRDRQRQEADAGRDGREAEAVLHVDDQVREQREQRRRDRPGRRPARRRTSARAAGARSSIGSRLRALDDEERGEQHARSRRARRSPWSSPSRRAGSGSARRRARRGRR